jgi:hypothetical protein
MIMSTAQLEFSRDILTRTERCVETSRATLAQAAFRIARSRRVLNPAWGLSGGADPSLRESIRTRLSSGSLFPANNRVVAGRGSQEPCLLCGGTVYKAEVQYDVKDGAGRKIICHVACYLVWRQESSGVAGAWPADNPGWAPSPSD